MCYNIHMWILPQVALKVSKAFLGKLSLVPSLYNSVYLNDTIIY
jgi:hypothetical protein